MEHARHERGSPQLKEPVAGLVLGLILSFTPHFRNGFGFREKAACQY